jgi:preprotein translocase subunit YajC
MEVTQLKKYSAFKKGDEVIGIVGRFNGVKGIVTKVSSNGFNVEVMFVDGNYLFVLFNDIQKIN